MSKAKIVGYWRRSRKEKSDLPWPVPYKRPWKLKTVFIKKVVEIQKMCKSLELEICYRGMAESRIEKGVFVGSCEYVIDGYIWPHGYIEHYVIKHGIKPPAHFINWVMNFSLDEYIIRFYTNKLRTSSIKVLRMLAKKMGIKGYTKKTKVSLKKELIKKLFIHI